MDDIDLNISNYTTQELEHFFDVAVPYTVLDLQIKKHLLLNGIQNEPDDSNAKKQMTAFINNGYDILEFIINRNQINNFVSSKYDDAEKINRVVGEGDGGDDILRDNIENKTRVLNASGNHDVQQKQTMTLNDQMNPSKYLNPIETFPTHIARSDLNGIKRKSIFQQFVFNTQFRDDYDATKSTNYSVVLPYPLKNVLSLSLKTIHFPNIQYLYDSISYEKKNDYLFIVEHTTNLQAFIVIPNGTYTLDEFVILLKDCINTQLGSLLRFEVVLINNKITIRNTTNTFYLNFIVSDGECANSTLQKKLGWLMGFRNATYDLQMQYSAEGFYNPVDEYMYVSINDFNQSQTQIMVGVLNQSFIGDNVLAVVPWIYSDQCIITGGKREYYGPVHIQKMHIRLLNKYGEPVNLENMDYSFVLEFEQAYDI